MVSGSKLSVARLSSSAFSFVALPVSCSLLLTLSMSRLSVACREACRNRDADGLAIIITTAHKKTIMTGDLFITGCKDNKKTDSNTRFPGYLSLLTFIPVFSDSYSTQTFSPIPENAPRCLLRVSRDF